MKKVVIPKCVSICGIIKECLSASFTISFFPCRICNLRQGSCGGDEDKYSTFIFLHHDRSSVWIDLRGEYAWSMPRSGIGVNEWNE